MVKVLKVRSKPLSYRGIYSRDGGSRTHKPLSEHRILSPACLPVSPHPHLVVPSGIEPLPFPCKRNTLPLRHRTKFDMIEGIEPPT